MVFTAADDIRSEVSVEVISPKRGVRLIDCSGDLIHLRPNSVAKGQLGKRVVNASRSCVNMTSPVEAVDAGSHGRWLNLERCGWD